MLLTINFRQVQTCETTWRKPRRRWTEKKIVMIKTRRCKRPVFGFVFCTWNWDDFWRRSWGLPRSFIETKTLRFCNPDTKNFKKWTLTRSQKWDCLAIPVLGPHAQLSKRTKEKHFYGPIFGTVWQYQKRDRKLAKSTAKANPCRTWITIFSINPGVHL